MPRKKIKDKLTKFREAFFQEKYRFDQGNAFLVFINFALLVTTLVKQTGSNTAFIKYYVAGGLLLTWLLGYFLDRFVKVQDIQERVVWERSPIWKEIFQRHNEHDRKFERLLNRLESLEHRMEKLERKLNNKA